MRGLSVATQASLAPVDILLIVLYFVMVGVVGVVFCIKERRQAQRQQEDERRRRQRRQGDQAQGMSLLLWNGYGGANRTCELTLID